ncbi:MAG: PAS domain S-box protein, partial [Sphingobacteriales bacterium]
AYFQYFIRSGYRAQDAESKEVDRYGQTRFFMNNLIGIVEDGRLVRAWGTQRDVTDQKKAEDQLREREARYRGLFETMEQGFCVIEVIFNEDDKPVDYRFVEVNPVFSKHTGLQDAVGRTARELLPGLEPHWFDIYGKVAATGVPARFTEGSDSMGRWFDVYAFSLGNPGTRQVALLFSDITERKRTEIILRESEMRFQNLVREATVGIVLLTGPEMKVEIANEAYGQLIDRTPAELLGRELFTIIPDTEAYFRPIIKQVFDTGAPYYLYDAPYTINKDGKVIEGYLNAVYQPYRDQDRKVSGVLILCNDVTESMKARQALEESEAKFRTLSETLPELVWMTNENGEQEYASSKWEEYTGIAPASDETWAQIVHPADLAAISEAWKSSLETGRFYRFEVRLKNR